MTLICRILLGIVVLYFSMLMGAFAQVPPPAPNASAGFNSARIVVISGGHLDFMFNSISDYVNGVTLNGTPPNIATQLGIELQDNTQSIQAPSSWDLFVEMDGELIGPGGTTMNAENIEIECVDASGGIILPGSFVAGYRAIPVTPAQLRIVNSGPPGNSLRNRVQLNFRCGDPANVNPNKEDMTTKEPGMYTGNLIITLEPDF